jgi:4-hydroxy-tetrahydrodipicolinate synthase
MVTPFDRDGGLDLDAAPRPPGRRRQRRPGDQRHDGSPDDHRRGRDALLRAVEAVGGRARVVAASEQRHQHTLELTRAAEKAGAHGVLVVTPYYNKPPQSGLLAHFTAVADATGLPVILYDIPGRTGVPIATETLVQLAEHDRIVAVKDAKNDLYEGSWVMARTDLAFYSGADELNLAWLTHGGSGVISVVGHAATERYAEMVTAVDAGDRPGPAHPPRAAARRPRDHDAHPGRDHGQGALQLTGVWPTAVRLPLVEATDEQVECCAPTWSRRTCCESSAPGLGTPPLPEGGLPSSLARRAGRQHDGARARRELLVIDCGSSSPRTTSRAWTPPRLLLEGRLGDVVAIVLTHYEDHIGAVPTSCGCRRDCRSARSSARLVEAKLVEHRISR